MTSPAVLVVDPRSGVAHCDPECTELEGVPLRALHLAVAGYDVVLLRCGECCKPARHGRGKSGKRSGLRPAHRAQVTVYDELDRGDA